MTAAPAPHPAAKTTLVGRLKAHMPTREKLAENRWLRPFAKWVLRPELWRFTRRSVPRGVALGLFVGVTIPFAHTFIAVLLAVGVRANVPISAAFTWFSNPLTWPLMWWAAYRIGRFILHMDAAVGINPIAGGLAHHPATPVANAAGQAVHHGHGLAGMGIATASGLFVEATVLASVGYLVSGVVWRMIVARRRAARREAARARHHARLAAAESPAR